MTRRPIDIAPQARKHTGPYYPADKMRRILAPEVTDPSLIERVTEAFNEVSARESMFVVGIIALCVFCAALIVVL